MRRLFFLCAALAAAAFAPSALADDNTSFETGDLSGWTVSTPSGSAGVLPGGAPGGGAFFGSVTAGSVGEYQSISTSVYLQAGDAVSAAFAFVDGDYCPYNDEGEVVVYFDGNVVATFMTGDTCASGDKPDGPSAWGEEQIYVTQDGYYTVVARVRNGGDSSASSSVWLDKVMARIPRAAYCAGAGNTGPDGTAVAAGSFLDLRVDQPFRDGSYAGATLARFVEGKGLTCDAAPSGFVQDGLAGDAQHVPSGLYAYFRQG